MRMQTAGLFGSGILEAAVGIVFLYFVLSTIASSINEAIATVFKWRASNLEWALGNLISDPDVLRQIVQHPLIRGMGQNKSSQRGRTLELPRPDKLFAKVELEGRPSYLAARTFALAMMHSLSNPSKDVVPAPKPDAPPAPAIIDMKRIRETAARLTSADISNRVSPENVERLKQARILTGETVNALLEECRDPDAASAAFDTAKRRLIDGLQHSTVHDSVQLRTSIGQAIHLDDLRDVLAHLPDVDQPWATKALASVQGDIESDSYQLDMFRTSIEAWFDSAMERAAGVYKRRTMLFLAVIAAIMVGLSGADSIHFVTRLYVDSALRAQLVQQAGQIDSTLDMHAAIQSLEPFATLFGYSDNPGFNTAGFAGWALVKLIGMVITVFAILLGAPFWFDVLGKVANIRGAGPKPPSSAESSGT